MINIPKIKSLMALHGDTQESLAGKMGVSKQLIGMKLTNRSRFSVEQLLEISKIYGVTINELLNNQKG